MTQGVRFGVLALAAAVLAAAPARAVDKEAVNAAVERGVKFLQGMQQRDGTWTHEQIGLTALCGLTLLECGVAVDDDGIQKAAAAVRNAAVTEDQTYSIALSILFLDKLGEPVDVALIESLTVRLLAGQTSKGGWGYTCPRIGAEEKARLANLVHERARAGRPKDFARPEPGRRGVEDLPREIRGQLKEVQRQQGAGAIREFGTDNSNTQFAVLALWVGRRQGLPVDGALLATDRFYRGTVQADGGWSYLPPGGKGLQPALTPSPAMTCAGLIGIAVAYGAWNESVLRTDPKGKEPSRPGAAPAKGKDPSQDNVVKGAFRLLGHWVDGMAAGQGPGKVPQINMANGKFYYFLWSLERVSVAYGIDKVGKTDWYDWGAEILLANQDGGGWTNGCFRGPPDTCFALLVLRRANLAQDLTRALKSQVKDGDMQAALRQGGTSGAELVKGRKPFFDGPVTEDPKHKPEGDEDAQAARLAKQLLAADGDKQQQILNDLRDRKGAAYTQALAGAIRELEGDALKKAREALAERMSRMNSATLGVKLEDDDAEVRRAAALAVAMKEDKAHVYRLIEMLSDPEATVTRAAYAALKSLSKEDFGPARGATRQERAKAILAWKAWWAKQQQADK